MKKDKNGVIIKVGNIMTGLYLQGDGDGIVVKNKKGELFVKDSDGDLLMIDQVIKNGAFVKV